MWQEKDRGQEKDQVQEIDRGQTLYQVQEIDQVQRPKRILALRARYIKDNLGEGERIPSFLVSNASRSRNRGHLGGCERRYM
jgi:hypothetical protein